MKIKEITYRNRRDFSAVLVCEGCGHTYENKSCYDDRNYHDNVIPSIKCPACGKSRIDLGIFVEPTPTKYQPWEII